MKESRAGRLLTAAEFAIVKEMREEDFNALEIQQELGEGYTLLQINRAIPLPDYQSYLKYGTARA